MSKMKIKAIQLKLNGLKGMQLEYATPMVGAMAFKADSKTNFTKPVQGRMKEIFGELSGHVALVVGLVGAFKVSRVEYLDSAMQFSGELTCVETDRILPLSGVLVKREDGVVGYEEMEMLARELRGLAKDYVEKENTPDYRQMLIDFQVQMPKSGVGDVDAMSPEQQLEAAKELLFKHNYMVLGSGEEEEVTEEQVTEGMVETIVESEDPFNEDPKWVEVETESTTKGKKMKVA